MTQGAQGTGRITTSAVKQLIYSVLQPGTRRCERHGDHDPWRSDDDLDALVTEARKALRGAIRDVVAAAEGMKLTIASR